MHFPEARQLPWLLSMLGFLLAAAATLYIGSGRHLKRNDRARVRRLAIVFIAFVIANAFIGEGSLNEKLTAIKRWLQFWGVLFIFATARFRRSRSHRWVWAIFLIALVQLPLAIYQRIVLVPLRSNMPERVVPDIVTGTLEADMWGAGNNNTMAYLLILACVALISSYRDGAISASKLMLLLAVVVYLLGSARQRWCWSFCPSLFSPLMATWCGNDRACLPSHRWLQPAFIALFLYIYVGLQGTDGRVDEHRQPNRREHRVQLRNHRLLWRGELESLERGAFLVASARTA